MARTFIITTKELVHGVYRVQAGSAKEAVGKFGDPGINWEAVEQIEYTAISLEVQSIAEEKNE